MLIDKRALAVCAVVLGLALSASGQGTIDYHPTDAEIAANKRRGEVLLHPTLITLRLASQRRDVPREEPSTTPSPYTVDQWVHFELFMTQNSAENLVIWNYGWPYYEYRPELIRDGDIVSYTKEAREYLDRAEKETPSGSMSPGTLLPGREYQSNYVKLEDWYESPLSPGRYQLIVRKRFALNGDWAESNPVTFDVVTRRAAAPIPKGLKLRLVPEGTQPQPEGQPYRLGSEVDVAVLLVNDSDQRVRVSVIDRYYGHRLQLFKDGKLIPYNEETTKLIESKDANPRMIEVVSDFFLDPKTSSQLDGLSLKKWYGPLPVGHYRLTDRRRFEIDGPWTADSAELWFEVVKQ